MMSCIKLPKWLIEEIDKRRRGFLWSGKKRAKNGQCRVSWDRVCRSIAEGGLGMKNIETQNLSLLMKFVHKLHTETDTVWVKWFKQRYYLGDSTPSSIVRYASKPWKDIMDLMEMYRAMTIVTVGNGQNTSFWFDSWLGNRPLSIIFPALFSHITNKEVAVSECFQQGGWIVHMRNLTSTQAELELSELQDMLHDVQLTGDDDKRRMRFGQQKDFCTKSCYEALNFGGTLSPFNQQIWNSLAPRSNKIFMWLSCLDRIFTMDRLWRKGMAASGLCPFGCNEVETIGHLLLTCNKSTAIWSKFGIHHSGTDVQGAIQRPSHAVANIKEEWGTIFIAICWNIWLSRNRKVYDNLNIPINRVKEDSIDTIKLWSNRTKKRQRQTELLNWLQGF